MAKLDFNADEFQKDDIIPIPIPIPITEPTIPITEPTPTVTTTKPTGVFWNDPVPSAVPSPISTVVKERGRPKIEDRPNNIPIVATSPSQREQMQPTNQELFEEAMARIRTPTEEEINPLGDPELMEEILAFIIGRVTAHMPAEYRVTRDDVNGLREKVVRDFVDTGGANFTELTREYKHMLHAANMQWRMTAKFKSQFLDLIPQISKEFNAIYNYVKNATPAQLIKAAARPESGTSSGDRGVAHSNPLLAMLTGVKMARSEPVKRVKGLEELTTPEELALAREMGLL